MAIKIILGLVLAIWGLGALILLFTELGLSRSEEYQEIPAWHRIQFSLLNWLMSPMLIWDFFRHMTIHKSDEED